MKSLLLASNGIDHIRLSLLPFITYLFLGLRFDREEKGNTLKHLYEILIGLVGYLITICIILFSNDPYYEKEYTFENATSRYGLLTSLRLDITNNYFKEEDYSFDMDENLSMDSLQLPPIPSSESVASIDATDAEAVAQSEEALREEIKSHLDKAYEDALAGIEPEEPSIPEPIVYGDNALDIDFTALAASTSNSDLASLDEYVASLTPSKQNPYTGLFKGKNLIFLSAEAFTKEVVDPLLTPTLYRMTTQGFHFTDFYQPASAGTTGGEYNNIFGMPPTNGGSSVKDTATHLNYMTMGYQLNRLGYYGKMYHNGTLTYYDRNLTHVNMGYSDGFMARGNGMEDLIKAEWPGSDKDMIAATLDSYIDKQPFNIYYMTVSGHSNYSLSENAQTKKHWDRVKDLEYSDIVKSYLACQLELEDAMTYLIDALTEKGIEKDTVICIVADHFPYGLDHGEGSESLANLAELYGEPITNSFVRDHNQLILWCGSLEDSEPVEINDPVTSIDVLPTLLNLFGIEYDSRLLPGRDVFSDTAPLIFNLNYEWKTNYGMYTKKGFTSFVPEGMLTEDYVKIVNNIVKNKIKYSKAALNTDYFRHVFGNE